MEFIIIILIVIIVILIGYLFLLKKELKRIKKRIQTIKKENSNNFIHSEMSMKELNDLINEINLLMKELKEKEISYEKKNTALKKMMTNISHDLRTPLTSALGYIDIIINSNLSEEEKSKELKVIRERLKRLEELINSFFEFSKIVSSNNKIDLEKVNLIALLEENIAHFYEDFTNYHRKIIFNNNISKVNILTNREMLMRVFENLVGNAFKHGKGDLEVKIEIKKNIIVTYTNELLDENLDINHIFDEFYTVDISRTKGNTGLGLAIAKEFIENLDGKIFAKKEKKKLSIVIELKYNG